MTLETYLERKDAKTLTALASDLGISKGRLSQLRKSTDWPPELALAAESVTGGAINASALSKVIARARQTGAAA